MKSKKDEILTTDALRLRTRKKKTGEFHHGALKDALIAQAIRVLQESGTSEFSLRTLAKSIGVSHVAAFNHFPTKAHLLAEVAIIGYSTLGAQLRDSSLKPVSMHQAMRIYLEFAVENPGLFHAMFDQSIKPFRRFPGLEEAARKSIEPLLKMNPELDREKSERRALLTWATAHGLVTLLLADQLPGPFKQLGGCPKTICAESIERFGQLDHSDFRRLENGL